MFSKHDLIQIQEHGITEESAIRQWNIVNQKQTNVSVVRPALKGDGIFVFNEQEVKDITKHFARQVLWRKIAKFVPASGAATRMFKDLFIAMDQLSENPKTEKLSDTVLTFFDNLSTFAFFEDLKTCLMNDGLDIDALLSEKNYLPILSYLLTEKGLNYGKLPKGLVLFHHYGENDNRTAMEEHLLDASAYSRGKDRVVYLHFTVSPEYVECFKEKTTKEAVELLECMFGITYEVSYSFQESSTDTIAFTLNNEPFRNKEGNLVFRPGGHGSLIENLNRIDAEIVSIQNIDNVAVFKHKGDLFEYKELLICHLLRIRKQVFAYLKMLNRKLSSLETLKEVESFLAETFFIHLEEAYYHLSVSEKQKYLYRIMDRPIRVCGMVKRENEPGGGPFWVKDANGKLSLQIVETSEMDLSDAEQKAILERSEFFNPVDLVCSVKNHRGKSYNLLDYIDHSRYFISEKSYEGQTIKAIENPGLWNGAMSDWLTVFVCVPLTTFTPVKTVNDLLQKAHTDVHWEN
jgi:hypothetical protein